MEKITSEEYDVKFTIPDWTVRTSLAYDSEYELDPDGSYYERLWRAAKRVIRDWECERMSIDDELEELEDLSLVELIKWAAITVFSSRNKAKEVPKN
jgi:hypothetical protein